MRDGPRVACVTGASDSDLEHLAAALKEPVHELADARTDTLHPAGDRMVIVRLDQQVHVIALDRVMDDAEAVPDAGLAQGGPEPSHEAGLAQGWVGRVSPIVTCTGRRATMGSGGRCMTRGRMPRGRPAPDAVRHDRSVAHCVECELFGSVPVCRSCHGERLGPWCKRRCRVTSLRGVRDLARRWRWLNRAGSIGSSGQGLLMRGTVVP